MLEGLGTYFLSPSEPHLGFRGFGVSGFRVRGLGFRVLLTRAGTLEHVGLRGLGLGFRGLWVGFTCLRFKGLGFRMLHELGAVFEALLHRWLQGNHDDRTGRALPF